MKNMFNIITLFNGKRSLSLFAAIMLALGLSGCGLTQEDIQALTKHVKDFQEKKKSDDAAKRLEKEKNVKEASVNEAYSDHEALATYHKYRRQSPPLLPALYVHETGITLREAKVLIGRDLLYINRGHTPPRGRGPTFSMLKVLSEMDRTPFQLWPVHYKQAGVSGSDIVRFANKRNMKFTEVERFVTKGLLNHAFHTSITRQIENLRP